MSEIFINTNGVIIYTSPEGGHVRIDLGFFGLNPKDQILDTLDKASFESRQPVSEVRKSLLQTGKFSWLKK